MSAKSAIDGPPRASGPSVRAATDDDDADSSFSYLVTDARSRALSTSDSRRITRAMRVRRLSIMKPALTECGQRRRAPSGQCRQLGAGYRGLLRKATRSPSDLHGSLHGRDE